MEHYWVIIRTPAGVHCYEIGEVSDVDLADRVTELRGELGVPDDADPFDSSTWDVQVSGGEPHPTLLAQAIAIHRLDPGDHVEPGDGLEGPRPPLTELPTADGDPPRPLMPHELMEANLRRAAGGGTG